MESKNYELSYLFPPSITEGEILIRVNKLSSLIEENKGIILATDEPKKRHLAYPVNKQKEAYFGWITFSMAPENIAGLSKGLKSQEGLLRHLLIEKKVETIPRHILRVIPSQPAKPRITLPKGIERQAEKLDLEALDKKLEEILGK